VVSSRAAWPEPIVREADHPKVDMVVAKA
jgi:hypothetical protein